MAIERDRRGAYLDANLAQVAQSPCNRRHGGGSGQFLPVMGFVRWNLLVAGGKKRSLKLGLKIPASAAKARLN